MCSRSIYDLTPGTRAIVQRFTNALDKRNMAYVITCTYRSAEEQAALYAQGRDTDNVMYLYNLNHLREIAKLPRFESVDKNSKLRVTNAKPWNSWHQYGRAIDIYPIEGGKIIWKSEHPLWHILFSAAEATGLERGPKWESAHFQHTEGLTFKNVMKA